MINAGLDEAQVGIKIARRNINNLRYADFIDGETVETMRVFWGAPKSLQMVTVAVKLKDTCSLEEKL